jgi:hypothetical protein
MFVCAAEDSMRKRHLLGCLPGLMIMAMSAIAQPSAPNEWTWLGGPSTGIDTAVYGTLGTPASGNLPGIRDNASTWTDSSGNFWLFGGNVGTITQPFGGTNGRFELNDLWKFNPTTKEWAWIGGTPVTSYSNGCYVQGCGQPGVYGTLGSPSQGNIPGGRDGSSTWVDGNGNLWLFGGEGFDESGTFGVLNDLWEFNPSTNEWTWMSGSNAFGSNCFTYDVDPGAMNCAQTGVYGTLGAAAVSNSPGSRMGASAWTDRKGNLWLFGGWGYDVNYHLQIYFNDLWEFNASTKQWTWTGGSSTGEGSACFESPDLYYHSCGEPGNYGTLGTPASGNGPGARNGANSWTDRSGNFWLFGGQGFDSNGLFSDLNDLWEFSPSSGQWTWLSGSSTAYGYYVTLTGVYGVLGTPAATNVPATRWGAANWTDGSGNLWLFGGLQTGWYGNSKSTTLNDLWEFNPSTNEWSWMGGNEPYFGYLDGVYGALGTPAPGNNPGDRFEASAWTDNGGNLWLFGGGFPVGETTHGSFGNDLWVYQPSNDPLPTTATPIFSPSGGTYTGPQTVSISDATDGAIIYYTTDGSTPTTSSPPFSSSYPISLPNSGTLQALAVAYGCFNSAIATATYTLPPQAATPTFSVPPGTYTSTQTVAINDATAGATIYYTTNGTTPTTSSTVYNGPITVSGSETVQAIATATSHSISLIASAMYTLNLPTVATPSFYVPGGTYNTPQTVTISDATAGVTMYYTTDGTYPTKNSPVYSGPITVSSTETINVIAMANNSYPSPVTSAYYTINPNSPQAATPIFSVPSGTYNTVQTVTISDATLQSIIYYTINGTTANTTNWTVYSTPVTVSSSETLQAYAAVNHYVSSSIASAVYTVNVPTAATPTFSVPAGTYTSTQSVKISDTTTGAVIYYTTDGTAPSTNSTVYSTPIILTNSETLEAIAVAGDAYADSAVASATYMIDLPQNFSVASSVPALSVSPGQSGTATISVTPLNGFSSTVSFACNGLPSGTSCTFSPATITPSIVASSTTLTVTTSATSGALLHDKGGPLSRVEVLAAILFCFGCVRRRRLQRLVLLAVSLAGLSLITACGTGQPATPQSLSSTVTVTATSGSLQNSTSFFLTVN